MVESNGQYNSAESYRNSEGEETAGRINQEMLVTFKLGRMKVGEEQNGSEEGGMGNEQH